MLDIPDRSLIGLRRPRLVQPLAYRGMGMGMGIGGGGVRRAGAVFVMSQLATADRIYQRTTTSGGGEGKGQGSIPVSVTVSAPGAIYARCRSAADGTTILQAPWRVTESAATGTLDVTGIDARAGWFYLDLSGDGVTWQNGTTAVGMGVLALLSGQSLMVRIFKKYDDSTTLSGAGVSAPANGRIFAVADSGNGNTPSTWVQPADAGTHTGAGSAELMTRLIALAGCNVGLVSKCEGATAITQWLPGQTYGDALYSTMDAAGGKFELVWWFQGHTDAQAGMGAATYKGHLDTLFAAIAAHNSFPSYVKTVTSIPNVASTSWGSTAAKEVIKLAAQEWAAANGAISLCFADIEMVSDGIHPNQLGSRRQARHAYRAWRPHFGAAHDDRGAVLGPSFTKSGVNLTIPYTLPAGATTLNAIGTPGSRFKVYRYGARASTHALSLDGTTPFTLDTVNSQIIIKLASDPGDTNLEIVPFGPQDPAADGHASGLYDDLVDGDGISEGRAVFPDPKALVRLGNRDLTVTGGSYGAGKFGNILTAGWGVTNGPALAGSVTGGTLECWARLDATSGAVRVLVGQLNFYWIGCQNNNVLVSSGSGGIQTHTNALPNNIWVHLALVQNENSTTVTLFIDGVAQTPHSFTQPFPNPGVPNGLGIRCFSNDTFYQLVTGQLVDEVAIWNFPKYTSNFTPPSAPYVGNEAGLIGLWHMNDNGLNAAA